MSNSLPSATHPPPGHSDDGLDPERRLAPRVDCLTVVTVVIPASGADPQQVIKAYSEDISVGVARLILKEPLDCQRLHLRFLLPTFGDRFVEAEIVSRSERKRRSIAGDRTTQYLYGVRFTGAVTDGSLIDPATDQPPRV